jgi:hypothetical protein
MSWRQALSGWRRAEVRFSCSVAFAHLRRNVIAELDTILSLIFSIFKRCFFFICIISSFRLFLSNSVFLFSGFSGKHFLLWSSVFMRAVQVMFFFSNRNFPWHRVFVTLAELHAVKALFILFVMKCMLIILRAVLQHRSSPCLFNEMYSVRVQSSCGGRAVRAFSRLASVDIMRRRFFFCLRLGSHCRGICYYFPTELNKRLFDIYHRGKWWYICT